MCIRDSVLAVKDNQPKLAESIKTFFEIGQAEGWKHTPYPFDESVEKDHGRLEVRRCWAFSQLDCLSEPQQWPDLKMFGVIEAERTINGKTSCERRLYIGSIAPDAVILGNAVRAHWGIENRVHWCLDVALNDDQMRHVAKMPEPISPSSDASSSILSAAITPIKKAVSYTHLDVYKRQGSPQFQGQQLGQGIRCAPNLHPQFQCFLRLLPQVRHTPPALQIVKQGLDTPALGIDPVSYTHLDVYKRQFQRSVIGNCSRGRLSARKRRWNCLRQRLFKTYSVEKLAFSLRQTKATKIDLQIRSIFNDH